MTSTEAIVFINAIFAGNPDGEVKFVASAPDKITDPILPDSFAIRITASARGEKATCLTVAAFEDSETESDKQSCLTTCTAQIALALIDILERKIHAKKLAAYRNN
jgi:hypothetical protein